jgi:hypothetical protein
MTFILWIIAVILVVAGIVSIIRGGLLWGILLIVLGLIVGPGGYSIFR